MKAFFIVIISLVLLFSMGSVTKSQPAIRILVVTGNHNYNKETFNEMFKSLAPDITFEIAEFPSAYDMFLPDNRNKYDVLVFYHMWQKITEEQKTVFAECIREGKPLVALHHSICAFDDWPEYWNIVGGKYFHKPTVVKGMEYAACSYIHDIHFTANISDRKHPVTKGINDFELFDETYKGYYVDERVHKLITTTETSSTPVIGWTNNYGKSRIVTLQSGHDTQTFQNPSFRKLLKQSVEWVYAGRK